MNKILYLTAFIILSLSSYSQIKTENEQTAEFYIRNVLMGKGVEVGEITHVGMIGGLGQFEAEPSIIGVKSGLVLSTGNVNGIKGPNKSAGFTSKGQRPKGSQARRILRKGDADLNKVCKKRTKDITVIEFDFVPVQNKLEFNYVFASEEYPEYAGSQYNDVFAFFLSGPNIDGQINLAVLPDGKTPITINTVNRKNNKKYYRCNSGFIKRTSYFLNSVYAEHITNSKKRIHKFNNCLMSQLQFDGLTKVLKVEYDVIPYQKYHLKIAIGDVSDQAFDSAVFLEAGSFVSVKDEKGKFYDTLLTLEKLDIDIDSILYGDQPATDSTPAEEINPEFEITDICFAYNSSELADSSKQQLDSLAGYLNENKFLYCSLWGYTDNTGTDRYNKKLSEERARNVLEYLVSKGVSEDRIQYQGNSFYNPKFDNSTEQGRARNRRVEITVE